MSLICVPLLLQEFLAGAHLAGGGGLVGGTQNDVENDVAEGKDALLLSSSPFDRKCILRF